MKKGVFANPTIFAATTLTGTIIGAGILGIPYTLAKAGFLYGLLVIIAIGLAFILLNLFMGEVVLRTNKLHQLTGYAELYLGKWGKRIMFFAMIFSLYGALIAYVIGEGAVLHTLFGVGAPWMFSLLFFAVTSFIVYRGVHTASIMELIMISLLVIVVTIIGVFSLDKITLQNLQGFSLRSFFLPYGVAVFAYSGLVAVPEMREVLGKNVKKMRKAIIIGSSIPVIIYVLFSLIVVGVVGASNFELLQSNDRIATVALSLYAHPIMGGLANILAFLSMFTSFLTIALALVWMYHYDYGISRSLSLGLTLILPLIVGLLNIASFIQVLGVTGAIAGGIQSGFAVLMFWLAKKKGTRKPEYTLGNHYLLGGIFILLFLFGVFFEIFGGML
ncbi:MAG: aromatic amino acid transport family protein [archaeon]|nr:aromatic amino acid transport family protein [archaeon]